MVKIFSSIFLLPQGLLSYQCCHSHVGPVDIELGFSYAILNDIYVLGSATLAFGTFLLTSFALKYGPRPVYTITTILQFAISI